MNDNERIKRFYSRYPSAEKYLSAYEMVVGNIKRKERIQKVVLEEVSQGRRERKIMEVAQQTLAPNLKGDVKEYAIQLIETAMRATPGMIGPVGRYLPREEEIKVMYDYGMKIQEIKEAIDQWGKIPMFTNTELIAPTRLMNMIKWKVEEYHWPLKIGFYHKYKNANMQELEAIVNSMYNMVYDTYAPHWTDRPIEDFNKMTNTTFRRILRVDHKDSGWASIKRLRDLSKKWNQVDGRFIELRDAEMPYHLQDWISPRGDTIEGYTFTPLTSKAALTKEGKEMNHCVGEYASKCLAPPDERGHHIYRIEGEEGERGTLGVYEVDIRKKSCGFELFELHGKNNELVSQKLDNVARRFVGLLYAVRRFDMRKAHKIREDFYEKYSQEYSEKANQQKNWRKAITAILPQFPDLQYILDIDAQMYPE